MSQKRIKKIASAGHSYKAEDHEASAWGDAPQRRATELPNTPIGRENMDEFETLAEQCITLDELKQNVLKHVGVLFNHAEFGTIKS